MIDAPGPWGSGSFVLTEGASSIDASRAVTSTDPFACIWLQTEDRSPTVRMRANPDYWNKIRGPRLSEVEFRNDLSVDDALEKVCTTEGEVDLVAGIAPDRAARVRDSPHARLVVKDPVRSLFGVINRGAPGLPLRDVRARRALNLALDRARLVDEVFHGYAHGLAGLTPPNPITVAHRFPDRLRAPRRQETRARRLWRLATRGEPTRALRIATAAVREQVARRVAEDLRETLGLEVDVTVLPDDEAVATRRRLAEEHDGDFDVLLLDQPCQTADLPALELHRAVLGRTGEYRAGPVDAEFDRRFSRLVRARRRSVQALLSNDVDRYTTSQAPALFLATPQTLYAVNRHVRFVPYATSLEFAETEVTPDHWSRRA